MYVISQDTIYQLINLLQTQTHLHKMFCRDMAAVAICLEKQQFSPHFDFFLAIVFRLFNQNRIATYSQNYQ